MTMRHPIRYRLEWLTLVFLRVFARVLPAPLAGSFGRWLGRCVGLIWRHRRRIAQENLARAFPEWQTAKIHQVAGSVFQNLGQTTFEILRISSGTSRRLLSQVDSPALDILKDAYREGKGGLLLSGHIGNWELFAGWIRALGYPLDVVVKPMRNPLSDSFYNARRRDLDIGIIHTQVATRGIVQAVRQKRLVAILADQYAGEDGVEVEFFGRQVSTPRGPAVLALKFGCPILSGVMIRMPDGRFRVEIDEPLKHQPTGDDEKDVVALTQAFTSRLENHIRRYPDQWLWTHRRWRG
jgi:KDO2-lipid IV(A) lauroyltransferase